ncbi:MAG: SAM-dependent methyltransferase [Oscillospiraceae bacterium]|nr:SAM-dependent methyltransferase [Oscillospiraceae bacterium]
MKDTNLGSRLLMAASFVDNGDTVCDVGCDHGKLSLYLVQRGKARQVIATDINSQPLQKAVDLFATHDLSHTATFLLTDGLQGIENTENITHVVIAGLGGHTMAQVIENAPFIKENRVQLVLLPAQSGYFVRRWLYENGFSINMEKTVTEKGKYYSCISAVYTGEVKQPDIYDMYIGESHTNTDSSAKGYFEMILSQLEKKHTGIMIDTGTADNGYADAVERIKQLINKL